MTRRRSINGQVAVLLVVLAWCAACSGSSSSPHPTGSPSAAGTVTPAASGAPASSASSGAPTPAGSPSPTAPVGLSTQVATATVSGAQQVETISALVLHRDAGILQLDGVIHCDQQAAGATGCTDAFAYSGLAPDVQSLATLAGVRFLDPAGLETYLAIRSADNRPWSSTVPEGLAVGSSQRVWIRLAAPPASVTTGTLLFPHGGPRLSAVPIIDGALPTEPTTASLTPGPDGVIAASPGNGSPPVESTSLTGLTVPVRALQLTVTKSAAETDVTAGAQQDARLSADVLFEFGKANLNPAAGSLLSGVASRIAKGGVTGKVTVTGFTDSMGSDSVNIPLSLARAKAVVARIAPLLTSAHVSLVAAGLGSAMPVAPNTNKDGSDDPAGRAMNRRVEIAWTKSAPATPSPVPAAPVATPAAPSGGPSQTFTEAEGGLPASTYSVGAFSAVPDGGVLAVSFDLTCVKATGATCPTAFDFAASPTYAHFTGSDVSGLTLLDPTDNSTRPVVVDTAFLPLVGGIGATSAPGVTTHIWAYFAPVSGSTATLIFPYGGPRVSVPVS